MSEGPYQSQQSVRDRSSVTGRTAVVTGGTSGIGRTITETFVTDGADVVICSRTPDDCEAVAAELNDTDLRGSVHPVEADVTNPDDAETLRESTVEESGDVDILVNNAGGGSDLSHLDKVEPDEWERMVDVNLTGTYNVTHAFADPIRESGGAIVNIASMAGEYAIPGMTAYGSAKAGIISLSQTLAKEWADSDVRVNAVSPGYIGTEKIKERMDVEDDPDRSVVDRDLGTPEEVADVVRFLASPAASFVTGQTVTPMGPPPTPEQPND